MTLIVKHKTSKKNYVLSLPRKTKKEFFSNLNANVWTEKITFWKTEKPFLADKTNKTSKTTLIEEERVISQDHRVAKLFSEYFISIPIKNMPKNMKYKSAASSRLASSLFLFFRYLFTSISSSPKFPKFTKDGYMTKYQIFSKMFSQSINANFSRVTVHSTAF